MKSELTRRAYTQLQATKPVTICAHCKLTAEQIESIKRHADAGVVPSQIYQILRLENSDISDTIIIQDILNMLSEVRRKELDGKFSNQMLLDELDRNLS